MSDLVEFKELDTHCLITLDDGKANALGFDMFAAINAAMDQADATGKVILIAGRPGKFSAGFDLSVMGQGGDTMMTLMKQGAGLSRRFLECPVPVVLAVSGHALAMGALLLLSADYRIGICGSYKLGLNEVAIGMPMPHFGVELARARLSKRALERSVNLAQVFDADSAVEAGYLDAAVEADELMAQASAVAQHFASLDMAAHKLSKTRVRAPLLAALDEALARDFQ